MRSNPADRGASNYQGSESVDRDGDGEADFTFLLNNGDSNTESRNLPVRVEGARYRQALISESLSFQTVSSYPWGTAISYRISPGYGTRWFYGRFEFFNGRKSKVYSNSIQLIMTTNSFLWYYASTFSMTLNGGQIWTTNATVTVNVVAPAQAIEYRISENSNSFGSWGPFNNTFSYHFTTNLGRWSTREIYVQLQNLYNDQATVSNRIDYIPWSGFGIGFNTNRPFVTSTNGVLFFSNSASLTRIRIANDAGFTGGSSPWLTATSNYAWSLADGPGTKTVYAIGTNDLFGLSSPLLSIALNPVSPGIGTPMLNGGSNSALSRILTVQLPASNAPYMRVSTNSDFGDVPAYTNFQSNFLFTLGGLGDTNRRWVYFQVSNDIWKVESPVASASILPPTLVTGSLTIANGAAIAPSNTLAVAWTSSGADVARLSTNVDFSTGTGWFSNSGTNVFTFSGEGDTNRRFLFLQLSNSTWELSGVIQSNSILPPGLTNFSAMVNSNGIVTNTNLLMTVYGNLVNWVRFSSVPSFSVATAFVPYQTNLTYLYPGSGQTNISVYTMGSNSIWGITRIITNNLNVTGVLPMKFTNSVPGGMLVQTNLTLYLHATNGQYMRISTNLDFSDGTGWILYVSNIPWTFLPDPNSSTRIVYAQVSNVAWGVLSPIHSNVFNSSGIFGHSIYPMYRQNQFGNSQITVWPFASNADYMRVSSNADFSSGTGWTAYDTNVPWILYVGGSAVTNWIYAQFSNSFWGTKSTVATNFALCFTNYYYTNSIGMVFVNLPGGWFVQGHATYFPPLMTNFLGSFSMGQVELNYGQWTQVANWAATNGYSFSPGIYCGSANSGDPRQPVTKITYGDSLAYCNALSQFEGRSLCYFTDPGFTTPYVGQANLWTNIYVRARTNGYRLATEAEWEYAYRGGTTGTTFFPAGQDSDYAWWSGNCSSTKIGATLLPNPFGVYDFAGSVCEWCFDTYYSSYSYTTNVDPVAPRSTTLFRVLRGGAWPFGIDNFPSYNRPGGDYGTYQKNYYGTRLVLSVP